MIAGIAPVVQRQNAALPRPKPGFDSRSAHVLWRSGNSVAEFRSSKPGTRVRFPPAAWQMQSHG